MRFDEFTLRDLWVGCLSALVVGSLAEWWWLSTVAVVVMVFVTLVAMLRLAIDWWLQ